MSSVTIRLRVNGRSYEVQTEPHRTLLEVVREDLRLTGAKEGCSTGECGACSMVVDDRLITSCLMLAPEADGADIITIEGLDASERLVLAHGIVGLAEGTGRHWTAVGRPGSVGELAAQVADLAWYGLRGRPG